MIKDITIGQFFPGNSVIHKLDPRIKLVLTFVYIVIVFLCKNFVSLASIVVALTVVILLSKISPKLIWKSVKPIFIIIAITSLLQIFYNKDGTRKEDGDDEEADEEEIPHSGKPGGYGEDDGEYYDAGEYITDENEMRSHKKDTQK